MQGLVDQGGNFLLPFCETDGVYRGYRYSVRPGRDPESTAYVLAVPVEYGKTGNHVFLADTQTGVVYKARANLSWKDGIGNYLKADGGPGKPPAPFVPCEE